MHIAKETGLIMANLMLVEAKSGLDFSRAHAEESISAEKRKQIVSPHLFNLS